MTFRPGTVDKDVYEEVVVRNAYRVPDRFPEGSIVIDIGAHIGCFSRLCAGRGAARVLAFELSPENCELFRQNTDDYPQIELFNKAVWTSDGQSIGQTEMFKTADGALLNTGSAHVIPDAVGDIETITLDTILADFEQVALVKMDCEGAEFEIVPATKSWSKVNQLVGEVHGYIKQYHVPDFYTELRKHFAHLTIDAYCPEYDLALFDARK